MLRNFSYRYVYIYTNVSNNNSNTYSPLFSGCIRVQQPRGERGREKGSSVFATDIQRMLPSNREYNIYYRELAGKKDTHSVGSLFFSLESLKRSGVVPYYAGMALSVEFALLVPTVLMAAHSIIGRLYDQR